MCKIPTFTQTISKGVIPTKNKIIFVLLLILSNFILNASTGVLEKELIYDYRAYYNFETNQVLNVEDLATRYLDDQYQYLWVAPPDPSVPLYQKGRPIALLNYKGFDYSFLTGLIAEEKDGVRTYPIWIYENSDDSKVVIANKDGKELISFDREINYSPDWFVFNELFDSVDRTKEQQDWLLACYDPSRIVMRYDLIVGEDDLMAYVWGSHNQTWRNFLHPVSPWQ